MREGLLAETTVFRRWRRLESLIRPTLPSHGPACKLALKCRKRPQSKFGWRQHVSGPG
jgi:hypothetical protein